MKIITWRLFRKYLRYSGVTLYGEDSFFRMLLNDYKKVSEKVKVYKQGSVKSDSVQLLIDTAYVLLDNLSAAWFQRLSTCDVDVYPSDDLRACLTFWKPLIKEAFEGTKSILSDLDPEYPRKTYAVAAASSAY